VLTELALKVLPASRASATLQCTGLDDTAAVAALCRALGSPFEVSGAAHMQNGPDGDPFTMIRLEGTEASVAYRAGELRKLLTPHGDFTVETDPERTTADWQRIRDVAPFHDRAGDVWRLSLKPTDAPGIVAGIEGAEAVYDWGGGLVWLLVPERTKGGGIWRAVAQAGGHATLMRGDRSGGAFQPLTPAVAALQDGLKQRFDPRGILNPGLMDQGAAA